MPPPQLPLPLPSLLPLALRPRTRSPGLVEALETSLYNLKLEETGPVWVVDVLHEPTCRNSEVLSPRIPVSMS